MRPTWMFVSVLGVSATAIASPNVQFVTVVNQGDAINSLAGDSFGSATQVVAGPDGSVAVVGLTNDNFTPVVIDFTPAATEPWTNTLVAEAGESYNITPISSTAQFDSFDNLAITPNSPSGTRLTFDAGNGGDTGVLQWNTGDSAPSDVAFDGDNKGYSNVGGATPRSGGSVIEMQVNGSGQALFPAVQNSSSQSALVTGDASGVSPIFVSTISAPLSNGTPSVAGTRVALGSDGSAGAVLDNGTSPAVYSVPANAGTPTIVSNNFDVTGISNPLIGYASGNGLNNAALILANGTGSGTQQVVLSKGLGLSQTQSVLVPQFNPNGNTLIGQMSPNGQIAMYVPSTTGDTIQYFNAASPLPTSTKQLVASTAPLTGPASGSELALDGSSSLKIEDLTDSESMGPEINSGGTVIFAAKVGDSPSDEKDALLAWQPGDVSPEILVADGDQIMVAGNLVTVDDFFVNGLSSDYDYYKNALNDQNGIALAVDYTGGPQGSGEAVLYTQIPEPSTIALLSVASFGLLRRRRRR